ncbi:MAG TPA: hypothetical protein VGJ20_15045 [Xanthobacteraceae bacterium]
MRILFGAIVGLTITTLGLVSSNDVRAQDPPKLPPLDKTLMPDQIAVVMVDFQNNFASPQGALYPLFEERLRDSHMIENSLNLVKVARELGIQVTHGAVPGGHLHEDPTHPEGSFRVREERRGRRCRQGALAL